MVLTEEQEEKFRSLCEEIKPGEYGRVVVSFSGSSESANFVQIAGEKSYRFHNQNAEASYSEPKDRKKSGRMG